MCAGDLPRWGSLTLLFRFVFEVGRSNVLVIKIHSDGVVVVVEIRDFVSIVGPLLIDCLGGHTGGVYEKGDRLHLNDGVRHFLIPRFIGTLFLGSFLFFAHELIIPALFHAANLTMIISGFEGPNLAVDQVFPPKNQIKKAKIQTI